MSSKKYRDLFNNWKKSCNGRYAIEMMLRRQLYLCPSCKADLDKCKRHVHHLVPISKLTEDTKNLAIDHNNMVVLCETCNLKQGNKIDERFN